MKDQEVHDVRIISGIADTERGIIHVRAEGVAQGYVMECSGLKKLKDGASVDNHQILTPEEIELFGGETLYGAWQVKPLRY